MKLSTRLKAFENLGKILREHIVPEEGNFSCNSPSFQEVLQQSEALNPWFTTQQVMHMLHEWGQLLMPDKLERWLNPYLTDLDRQNSSKNIAVIMAGNIPLAGFHDFLCVLMSGHNFYGKTSSKDRLLLPFLANILCEQEADFSSRIRFTEETMKGYNAVIATGNNQSAALFEKYFSDTPRIIRRNRTGLAILTGKEDLSAHKRLCEDIFLYFGLGCRSVTNLLLPEQYDFTPFLNATETFRHYANHHKYISNFQYRHTLLIMSGKTFKHNGFLILTEDDRLETAVTNVHYRTYRNMEEVKSWINAHPKEFQCIVSETDIIEGSVPFGMAQHPSLGDYADGIDTMDFLLRHLEARQ